MKLFVFLVLVSSTQAQSSTKWKDKKQQNCGYSSCPAMKQDMVNVHIVPHTHDDVGWLQTVDQYYDGSLTFGVHFILDSVTEALQKNRDRRFIYVETVYFWKWWTEQPDQIRHRFKQYVSSGQLEFIGGAWSMNDEATTHYQSIIDQFSLGLRKLNETFGECGRPKAGWQIDPFGHSKGMASIFAQLGYDGLLLGRIDYQDRNNRFATKTPEIVWKASSNLGNAASIFTGVMFNGYSPPPGFCFDIFCADEPIIDDKHSHDYNVDRRINAFLEYASNISEVYSTKNVIITMGGDFTYMKAESWYNNIDKIISYANKRQHNGSNFNLVYSTPSCYIRAVYNDAVKKDMKWKTKLDDYFPYASDPHTYWTGFYTSKPTIKRFERLGNNYLQVCKQLFSLADLGSNYQNDLDLLREAMGVMQHHDAITGTEKQHVAHDYERMLTHAMKKCDVVTTAALNALRTKSIKEYKNTTFSSCLLLNVSSCHFTESSKSFIVTIYNPLSRPVNQFVRFPVLGGAYTVRDPEGISVKAELIPIAEQVMSIPERKSRAKVDLIFKATDIPPLGFKSFYVERVPGDQILKPLSQNDTKNESVKLEMNLENGMLVSVSMNNITVPLHQEFLYYEGFIGNNVDSAYRSSGAYIFRPYENQAIKATSSAKFTIFKGELITEIHQVFKGWISQIIRSYKGENFAEFEWLVGSLPSHGPRGIEVISRFVTNVKSNSTFYTDSNGREMMKRVRNFRPTWKVHIEEPVAGNYYPVTSKILIRDSEVTVAVLTDRAQGGSSLNDGEVELMVHRNSINDDGFGVEENLNEIAFGKGLVARGTHYIILGKTSDEGIDGYSAAAAERDLAQKKLLQPWIFFSSTQDLTFDEYKKSFLLQVSGLQKTIPKNVHILTLEPWIANSFLLRLEHIFEKNEDHSLSRSVSVQLKGLFTPFHIETIKETTLGANQFLSENNRLPFETDDDVVRSQRYSTVAVNDKDMTVHLDPMQIRTFIIERNSASKFYVADSCDMRCIHWRYLSRVVTMDPLTVMKNMNLKLAPLAIRDLEIDKSLCRDRETALRCTGKNLKNKMWFMNKNEKIYLVTLPAVCIISDIKFT